MNTWHQKDQRQSPQDHPDVSGAARAPLRKASAARQKSADSSGPVGGQGNPIDTRERTRASSALRYTAANREVNDLCHKRHWLLNATINYPALTSLTGGFLVFAKVEHQVSDMPALAPWLQSGLAVLAATFFCMFLVQYGITRYGLRWI